MINKYYIYSQNVQNIANLSLSNVYEDIEMLKSIKNFKDIETFIEQKYGKFDDWFEKYFTNEIRLGIAKEDGIIELIFADNNDDIIFGRRWSIKK